MYGTNEVVAGLAAHGVSPSSRTGSAQPSNITERIRQRKQQDAAKERVKERLEDDQDEDKKVGKRRKGKKQQQKRRALRLNVVTKLEKLEPKKVFGMIADKLGIMTRAARKSDDDADKASKAADKASSKDVDKSRSARRAVAGRSVAVNLRHQRLQVAHAITRASSGTGAGTGGSSDAMQQTAAKRAALLVLSTPLRAKQGGIQLDCRNISKKQLQSFGAYGYFPGAAYDHGATVPQFTDRGVPKRTTEALLRDNIGRSTPPAGGNYPAPTAVPQFVRLPAAIVRHQPTAPLLPMAPPPPSVAMVLPVPTAPQQPIRTITVPAAQQYPTIVSPQRPDAPPPPPIQTAGPAAPPVTPLQGGPSFADSGWLAEDVLIADVAGAFDSFLGACEYGLGETVQQPQPPPPPPQPMGPPRPQPMVPTRPQPGLPPGARGPRGPQPPQGPGGGLRPPQPPVQPPAAPAASAAKASAKAAASKYPYHIRLGAHRLRMRRVLAGALFGIARQSGLSPVILDRAMHDVAKQIVDQERQLARQAGHKSRTGAEEARHTAVYAALRAGMAGDCR